LPYVCCAKEDATLLTLPTDKLCENDAPIVIALEPLDGVVKAFANGKEIPAIINKGGQNLFDPSKVVFAANVGSVQVSFTVNGVSVASTIKVCKQLKVKVEIANSIYSKGALEVDFKVTTLNGIIKDIDSYIFDFGDQKESNQGLTPITRNENETVAIKKYQYDLTRSSESVFNPVLRIANTNKCSTQIAIDPVYAKLVINKDTKINIYYNYNRGMAIVARALKGLKSNELQNELLPFYGSEQAYMDNVKLIPFRDDRTFHQLNLKGQTPTGNVISLVFQDEANTFTSRPIIEKTNRFKEDVKTFRERLDANFGTGNPNYYRGTIFELALRPRYSSLFTKLLKAVDNGTAPYSGVYGLAETRYDEKVRFVYGVQKRTDQAYYMGLIKQALLASGYSL